jgi:transposase
MISLDELQEALLWIYRAELGTLELAAERLEVNPSTVYRWQQKWARS